MTDSVCVCVCPWLFRGGAACCRVRHHDHMHTSKEPCLLQRRGRMESGGGEADLISTLSSCHAVGVRPLPQRSLSPHPPTPVPQSC